MNQGFLEKVNHNGSRLVTRLDQRKQTQLSTFTTSETNSVSLISHSWIWTTLRTACHAKDVVILKTIKIRDTSTIHAMTYSIFNSEGCSFTQKPVPLVVLFRVHTKLLQHYRVLLHVLSTSTTFQYMRVCLDKRVKCMLEKVRQTDSENMWCHRLTAQHTVRTACTLYAPGDRLWR